MLDSSKAPMVELEIPGSLIFTIPVSTINQVVTDMSLLADTWYECMEAIHWLIGYRFSKPERFATDVEIGMGGAHSGYPMMSQPLSTKYWDLQYLTTNGVWSFFHEIGHNLVKRRFVPTGASEVTNNLIPVMVNTKVMKVSRKMNTFYRNLPFYYIG